MNETLDLSFSMVFSCNKEQFKVHNEHNCLYLLIINTCTFIYYGTTDWYDIILRGTDFILPPY